MDLELARHQWADGSRRVENDRGDRARSARLTAQIDRVTAELRRRLGQTFTLQELADLYEGADRWTRDAVDTADPEAPPALDAGSVADAAFHAYARGASDYAP